MMAREFAGGVILAVEQGAQAGVDALNVVVG